MQLIPVQFTDFLGINFYTSEMVYPVDEGTEEVSYHKDDDAELYQDESWFKASWNAVTPWGLRSTMNWIKAHYPGVDVYITENGVSDRVGYRNKARFYLDCLFSCQTWMICKGFTTTNITQTSF